MGSLGSFGAVEKTIAESQGVREPDTFDFYDETFAVIQTTPSALPLMQFAAAMASADDEDGTVSMEALGAMYNMLRYCIEPADWPRFERLAQKRHAGFDELLPITQAVWAAVGAGPTEGPSASQGGPSTTSTSSKGDSRNRKDRRSKQARRTSDRSAPNVAGKVAANEWTPPPGRPDLAVPLRSVESLAS